MDITITSQEKTDYLFIETNAVLLTAEDLIGQSEMLYEEIEKYSFKKILIDESETQLPKELIPYFDLVKNYIIEFPVEIRELKIAVVTGEEYQETAKSRETLCVSRGLNYCSFLTIEEAEKWLLS